MTFGVCHAVLGGRVLKAMCSNVNTFTGMYVYYFFKNFICVQGVCTLSKKVLYCTLRTAYVSLKCHSHCENNCGCFPFTAGVLLSLIILNQCNQSTLLHLQVLWSLQTWTQAALRLSLVCESFTLQLSTQVPHSHFTFYTDKNVMMLRHLSLAQFPKNISF